MAGLRTRAGLSCRVDTPRRRLPGGAPGLTRRSQALAPGEVVKSTRSAVTMYTACSAILTAWSAIRSAQRARKMAREDHSPGPRRSVATHERAGLVIDQLVEVGERARRGHVAQRERVEGGARHLGAARAGRARDAAAGRAGRAGRRSAPPAGRCGRSCGSSARCGRSSAARRGRSAGRWQPAPVARSASRRRSGSVGRGVDAVVDPAQVVEHARLPVLQRHECAVDRLHRGRAGLLQLRLERCQARRRTRASCPHLRPRVGQRRRPGGGRVRSGGWVVGVGHVGARYLAGPVEPRRPPEACQSRRAVR